MCHITSIRMERFINCNCEGQSNSQFMDLFPVSKSRGCSHVFRNYYWWQLPPIFSLVFSPLSFSFASCAIQLLLKKHHRLSLWMPAMNSDVRGPFLRIQVLNPSATAELQLIHLPSSHGGKLHTSAEQLHISQFPTSTRLSHAEGQNRTGSGAGLEQLASL